MFVIVMHIVGGVDQFFGPYDSFENAMLAAQKMRVDLELPITTSLRVEELKMF